MKIDRNLVVLTVMVALCGISIAATITYYYSIANIKITKFEDRFNVSFKSVKYDELDYDSGDVWVMDNDYTVISNSFSTVLNTNPNYRVNVHITEIDVNRKEYCKIFAESWLRNEKLNENINVSAVIAYAKLNDSCEITLGDLLNYIFNVKTEFKLNNNKFCILSYKECSSSWKKCWLSLNVTDKDRVFAAILLPPSKYNETLVFSTAIYSS